MRPISSLCSHWNSTVFLSQFCASVSHVWASGHDLLYTTRGSLTARIMSWQDTGEFTEVSFVWVQPGRERALCPKWTILGAEPLSKRANVACPWLLPLRSAASWRCIWSTVVIKILFVCLFPAVFLACSHTLKDPWFRAICLVTKNKKQGTCSMPVYPLLWVPWPSGAISAF